MSEEVLKAGMEFKDSVKPYRLGRMIKTASQIMEMMVKSDFGVNYDECLIILSIVQDSILAVKEKNIHNLE